jgi:hypothetical protein
LCSQQLVVVGGQNASGLVLPLAELIGGVHVCVSSVE